MAAQSPDRQGAREAGGTIVACATPPGRGGVAVIRVSGEAVRAMTAEILGELPPARSACLVSLTDSSGELLDRGLALFFPAPNSFTGEDVLELQVHGSPVVCDLLVARICELGARPAGPGEFSRRAFLNDRMDLAQAEAVADLIDAASAAAARAAARSLRGAFSEAVEALVSRLTGLRAHLEATLDFPRRGGQSARGPRAQGRLRRTGETVRAGVGRRRTGPDPSRRAERRDLRAAQCR